MRIGFGPDGAAFDTNPMATNTVRHPGMGAIMHVIGRGCGLSAGQSFALGTAGSVLWEYVGEYHEKVSINDLVVTSTTGSIVGEAGYKLAMYAFDPDKRDFSASLSAGTSTDGRTSVHMGIAGEIPHDVKLRLGVSIDDRGFEQFSAFAKTAVKTLYKKDNGALSLVAESAPEYDYNVKAPQGGHYDQIGLARLLNGRLEVAYRYQGLLIRAELDVSGDFAMITSYAVDEYAKSASLDGSKRLLREQGYYYGAGVSGNAKLSASYGRVSVSGDVTTDRVRSIDGWDRDQEALSDDFPLRDSKSTQKLSLGYRLGRALLEGSVERSVREGTIKETTVREEEVRGSVGVTVHF